MGFNSIPCLTVIQPWASLIAGGAKRVETRNWARPTLIGQRIAIHAAARWRPEQAAFADLEPVSAALAAGGLRQGADVPLGAVLCTVRVAAIFEWSSLSGDSWRSRAILAMGDHTHGRYGWLLEDVVPLDPPDPAAGQRGVWNWCPAAGSALVGP